jgi:hypothetical protein
MELKVDGRHAPLFLLLSRALKIVIFFRREWQESQVRRELLVVDPQRPEFTRMNLSASPLSGVPLSTSYRQIFGVGSEETQVNEINLR